MRWVWVRIGLWNKICYVTTDHIPYSSQMACRSQLLVTRGIRQEILKEMVQTHQALLKKQARHSKDSGGGSWLGALSFHSGL